MEFFQHLGGYDVGWWKVLGVLEAVVAEPGEVEAHLVAGHELVVGEAFEAVGLGAVLAVVGVVAGYEVVEVGSGEGVLLEGEALVGAEVEDTELAGPRRGGSLAALEEEDVGLDAVGAEDAGWEGVDIGSRGAGDGGSSRRPRPRTGRCRGPRPPRCSLP